MLQFIAFLKKKIHFTDYCNSEPERIKSGPTPSLKGDCNYENISLQKHARTHTVNTEMKMNVPQLTGNTTTTPPIRKFNPQNSTLHNIIYSLAVVDPGGHAI
jgi:hypothetical protein